MAGITIAEARKQPDKYQVCKNGVIRDRATGRFCAAGENKAALTPIDSQRMNANRWQMARAAASAGLANVHGSDYKAIEIMFEKQVELAVDTARGHPSTQAAEFIMTKGGYTPDRSQAAAGTTVNIINVVEGAGAADLLREVRDIDVTDME